LISFWERGDTVQDLLIQVDTPARGKTQAFRIYHKASIPTKISNSFMIEPIKGNRENSLAIFGGSAGEGVLGGGVAPQYIPGLYTGK
jgi:hypothetical protein